MASVTPPHSTDCIEKSLKLGNILGCVLTEIPFYVRVALLHIIWRKVCDSVPLSIYITTSSLVV